MPRYDYECLKCGKKDDYYFDSLERANKAKVLCPDCSAKMTRQFPAPTFRMGLKRPMSF